MNVSSSTSIIRRNVAAAVAVLVLLDVVSL